MIIQHTLNDTSVIFHIRRHKKAVRFTIRPKAQHTYTMTVPSKATKQMMISIINSNQKEILKMTTNKPFIESMLEMRGIIIFGKHYILEFTQNKTQTLKTENIITLYSKYTTVSACIIAIKKYQKELLILEVNKLINKYHQLDNSYRINEVVFKYRSMKTRYGSCLTSKRQITLNLELSYYSLECLEYVFVHEMVHLKHPNHSSKFYQELQSFITDYQTQKQTLNTLRKQINEPSSLFPKT